VRLRLPSFRFEDHGVGRARHRLKGHNVCGVVRVPQWGAALPPFFLTHLTPAIEDREPRPD